MRTSGISGPLVTVKLMTGHHLEFLSLKEAVQARLSLHFSKCHIAGNHMTRLIFITGRAFK